MQQQQQQDIDLSVLSIPQIEAFNHFCLYDLKKRIEFFKLSLQEYSLSLTDFQIEKPYIVLKNKNGAEYTRLLYPRDVLHVHENKSYDLTIYATVCVKDNTNTINKIKKVELFKLPLMLGSIFCSAKQNNELDDYGGYFIVKGSEHVIIPQERPVLNRIIKTSPETIEITCKMVENADDEESAFPMTTRLIIKNNKVFFILNTLFKEHIPIAILLAAIAPTDIKNPYEYYKPYITPECFDLFAQSLLHHIPSKKGALNYISTRLIDVNLSETKRIELAKQKLNERLLINTPENKFEFLLLMINELFTKQVDDRDHLANKSFAGVNVLFDELIFGLFTHKFRKELKMYLEKKPTNSNLLSYIEKGFKRYSITPNITYSMSTGNWGSRKGLLINPMGISQSLPRTCFNAYLGVTRRLCAKSKEKIKAAYARMVHPSQYGLICVAETPDGQSVGLIKNMATLTEITRHVSIDLDLLKPFYSSNLKNGKKLIVGGDLVGSFLNTNQQNNFINQFKELRKKRLISRSISYFICDRYVELINSEGRLFRPLDTLGTFSSLQFLDAIESYANDVYIGFNHSNKEYTHVEVDPCAQFGVLASLIPFPNHNQACRNTYSTGMSKQAVSKMLPNTHTRMDNSTIQLNHPMKPLAQTNFFKNHKKSDDFLNGQPIMVGIIVHGFNQEDSGIFNRYSVDRGLLHTTSYHTYTNIFCLNDVVFTPEIKIPSNELHASIGTLVKENDLIIRPNFRMPFTSLPGRVHSARIIEIDSIKKIVQVQVMVRTTHRPKIGDKFTSRHAQKITCSLLSNAEDMPWGMVDGMIPDLLLSPHSFPSRLTQGHLVESFASEAACRLGKIQNANGFVERNYDVWMDLKKKCSYEETDFEYWESILKSPLHLKKMCSGTTGELLTLAVTVEPVYYQALKHMIQIKGMVRAKGPVNAITRQPVGGRKNHGGVRFGQMEGDCLIASGCSGLLLERTFVSSDGSFIFVCPSCGRQQNSTRKYCICKFGQKFEKFRICHSTKVLIQELQAVNIFIRFNKA